MPALTKISERIRVYSCELEVKIVYHECTPMHTNVKLGSIAITQKGSMAIMQIEAIIKRHAIDYGLFYLPNGGILAFGSRHIFNYDGIVKYYTPTPESVKALAPFLDGKSQPMTVRQGNVTGILGVTPKNTVFAVYFHDDSVLFMRRKRVEAIVSDICSAV